MKIRTISKLIALFYCLRIFSSCTEAQSGPTLESINAINLKKGEIVVCGPAIQQFGTVGFELDASDEIKKDFNLGLSLLHSFEYDESEKAFAKIIDKHPNFAMAYWGVAMSNFHGVWPTLPTKEELEKGSRAIAIAKSIGNKSRRESAYIDAIEAVYKDWDKVDHHTRVTNHEKAMEQLYKDYPNDKEAAIFYALALNAAADLSDKTYVKQKKAGAILEEIYKNQPSHPGIVHYIIHSYDYPELAELALPAARKYASIAPSSSHAQHMPSHIFTRLGLWDECIKSNLQSVESAKCYAEGAGIKGHWDEEWHGIDYLVYAYLQKGQNDLARKEMDYVKSIDKVFPENFKDAYAYAAIPARYFLENKLWKHASNLEIYPAAFPWQKFPWQKAIIHFTRVLGAANTGNVPLAEKELKELDTLHQKLLNLKDAYKANQVAIQYKAAEAWVQFAKGNKEEAVKLMQTAAEMEDKTDKSPVTPGEVLPARELLADLYMQLNQYDKAIEAYEADLKTHPYRFNALYGAGLAAEKTNQTQMAKAYYTKLDEIVDKNCDRIEYRNSQYFLVKARQRMSIGSDQ